MSTAAAMPTPNILNSIADRAAKIENTATMITAALVTTPALAAMPPVCCCRQMEQMPTGEIGIHRYATWRPPVREARDNAVLGHHRPSTHRDLNRLSIGGPGHTVTAPSPTSQAASLRCSPSTTTGCVTAAAVSRGGPSFGLLDGLGGEGFELADQLAEAPGVVEQGAVPLELGLAERPGDGPGADFADP
jgi:hypothetical protein